MMSKLVCVGALLAIGVLSVVGQAHELPRPESHGPAGIMADHTHKKGEVMTGYSYSHKSYTGLYNGAEKISAAQLASAGYTMMPRHMSMDMTMLHIMYAPTDRLTLLLMPRYVTMSMTMAPSTSTAMGGSMAMMPASREVDGLGDTQLSLLYNLWSAQHGRLIATVGASAPTGKVDIKDASGHYLPYGMQIGSGTWDFTPAFTYTGNAGAVSWGAQLTAAIRMENRNDTGYTLGDKYQGSAWGAYRLWSGLSLSARVAWQDQRAIKPDFTGPSRTLKPTAASPAGVASNYGGQFVDAGIGVNTVVTGGNFAGLRLGLEWVSRIDEDYNGYQLGLNDGINASISYSF